MRTNKRTSKWTNAQTHAHTEENESRCYLLRFLSVRGEIIFFCWWINAAHNTAMITLFHTYFKLIWLFLHQMVFPMEIIFLDDLFNFPRICRTSFAGIIYLLLTLNWNRHDTKNAYFWQYWVVLDSDTNLALFKVKLLFFPLLFRLLSLRLLVLLRSRCYCCCSFFLLSSGCQLHFFLVDLCWVCRQIPIHICWWCITIIDGGNCRSNHTRHLQFSFDQVSSHLIYL